MMFLSVAISVLSILVFDRGFASNSCFCPQQQQIDECSCDTDTVDDFNNIKIYPRLQSLLQKDYFRFFKVNLKRECPFWHDDSKCDMKYCHVQSCSNQDIPIGIKGASSSTKKCKEESNNYIIEDLNALNKTISAKTQQDLLLWAVHDDSSDDSFCVEDEHDEDAAEYVDLLLNPERYTGYKGVSANRIWNAIYIENCFRPRKPKSDIYHFYIQTQKLNDMCLEERVYYRAISGLHTSINIHLCANYLFSNPNGLSLTHPKGEWGPNLKEFQQRFAPENTNGEGPNWLKNLYFVYMLELRALAKASKYLLKESFFTGNKIEDFDTQMAITNLLEIIKRFPKHFDESSMFVGNYQAKKLKYEFRDHFRNVTRIMDCVGCDKCKLWGKLQTRGLGTALKILFSNKENKLRLQREEIVALFNAFGRLSTSVYKLDDFRQSLQNG